MTNTMTPPPHHDAPPAARLLGLWLRRSLGIGTVAAIAAAAVATCTLVALPIMLSRPSVYGAQADVLINPRAGQSDAATDRALATQEIILRSETVLDPVANATGIPVRRLEKALSVEVVNQSNVVRITMADRDAATAQRLTQLIVEEYEKQTSFPTAADLARATSSLEEQLRDLSATLAVDQGRLAKLASVRGPGKPIPTEERRLQVVVATTQQRLKIVQDQLAEAPLRQLEQAQPQPRILVPARLLKDPLSPRPVQAAATGALVGLFVAAVIIVVLFRPRFTEERDLWG
jgi:capsular polysaccharide biosynthesis protein